MKPAFVVTRQNGNLILVAKGGFEGKRSCGVGGYAIKQFKTWDGANKWINERCFKQGECEVKTYEAAMTW